MQAGLFTDAYFPHSLFSFDVPAASAVREPDDHIYMRRSGIYFTTAAYKRIYGYKQSSLPLHPLRIPMGYLQSI